MQPLYFRESLLKVVAGVPGDDVAVSVDGVAVNGCLLPDSRPNARDRVGRRISPWPRGDYRLGWGKVWLYAGNPRSWDSRYWGPGFLRDVMAKAAPLFVAPSVPPYERAAGTVGCGAFPAFAF